MNNAAMNISNIFLKTYIFHFLEDIPTSGILGSCGNSVFNFLKD